ncbi:MAG: hypothetical protein F6K36_05440 [Symploca sp. SIO3C6]|uniref:Uncharacterized protein n=1 Tax=Symploca sp. SIO1C4 TaxID=2607765 RepID=A0A6B3NE09_9CYAN|nr:hypothetical protein [Symploca sp. SIO3C6]NER29817.1 hypothetical protein [Symploca sp. SIO1C4]
MRSDVQCLVITEEYLTNLIGENPDQVRHFFQGEKPKKIGDFLLKLVKTIIVWLKFKSVRRLVREVDSYNAVIKAVDINDQLEEAGNKGVGLSNRERVIQALGVMKVDLVRALKTERILRENKMFITKHPQLFTTNLTALTALQVSDQACEYGRVLDQALQVAVGVQEEMRRLQNRS